MTTDRQTRPLPDFAAINAACRSCLPGLVAVWLPDGCRQGREWVARNPLRTDHRAGSFKVNTVTGLWADFATGDGGGDPISLYAYLKGLGQAQAARELQTKWGMGK